MKVQFVEHFKDGVFNLHYLLCYPIIKLYFKSCLLTSALTICFLQSLQ